MFQELLIHTVSIITPTGASGVSRYGDPIEEDGSPVTESCRIDPVNTREDLVGRDMRVTDFRGFFLPDSVVTSLSRVEWGDRTLRVNGEPLLFFEMNQAHHYEVPLQEVLT